MAGGRPKVALILTDDERVQLDSLAHHSRTAPHLARQARIILVCAQGHRRAERRRGTNTLFATPNPLPQRFPKVRRLTDEHVDDVMDHRDGVGKNRAKYGTEPPSFCQSLPHDDSNRHRSAHSPARHLQVSFGQRSSDAFTGSPGVRGAKIAA